MKALVRLFLLVIPLCVALPAPVAQASDGWCDTDPILLVHTPAGNLIPVFVTVGAHSLLLTPNTLLGSLVLSYTAVPTSDGKATTVQLVVTVPSLLLGPFATRSLVSTGPLGSGTDYASGVGVSGTPTTLTFRLPDR